MAPPDIMKLDLYGILGVSVDSTDKEIVKAYRKKALKCHPDKNPDNPEAAELFHQLSKALEILTDSAARAAFDKTRKAKEAADLRHKKLDSERKRFKEDLETREQAAQAQTASDYIAAKNLQAEIDRLRKEGSKLLEQEQEFLRKQLSKEENTNNIEENESPARLKVKWKVKKDDITNGGYDKEFLQNAFNKYGEVSVLVISSKKSGSAMVEFVSSHDALLAVQHEIGIASNPLTLSWISGQPQSSRGPRSEHTSHIESNNEIPRGASHHAQIIPENRDFESIVLMKMRQAEERRKLIEEMQNEDEDKT